LRAETDRAKYNWTRHRLICLPGGWSKRCTIQFHTVDFSGFWIWGCQWSLGGRGWSQHLFDNFH